MQLLFERPAYEAIMAVIVCLNSVAIGLQLDYPAALDVGKWMLISLVFFLIFFFEVVLKITAYGLFKYLEDRWNIYDLIVTALALIEIGATYHFVEDNLQDQMHEYVSGDMIQIMRIARLLRLARLFRELDVLIQSFILSLTALGWIFVLAFLWFFLCACFATIFIGRRDWMANVHNDGVDAETIRELRGRFKTVLLSMFSLFEVMTLEGWTDYVRPLLASRQDCVVFFFFFIFVTSFFLLNLVTAVVVDRTLAAQTDAKQSDETEAAEDEMMAIHSLGDVIVNVNMGRDLVTREDFEEHLHNSEIKKHMRQLHWNSDFMLSMFSLIDHDNDGECSLSHMVKLWIACSDPLDTRNYVRFQINLARRLEYQEKMTLTMLHALQEKSSQKFQLHSDCDVTKESFLQK